MRPIVSFFTDGDRNLHWFEFAEEIHEVGISSFSNDTIYARCYRGIKHRLNLCLKLNHQNDQMILQIHDNAVALLIYELMIDTRCQLIEVEKHAVVPSGVKLFNQWYQYHSWRSTKMQCEISKGHYPRSVNILKRCFFLWYESIDMDQSILSESSEVIVLKHFPALLKEW